MTSDEWNELLKAAREKLLPCHTCGKKDKLGFESFAILPPKDVAVVCMRCKEFVAAMPLDEAVEDWNQRQKDAPP